MGRPLSDLTGQRFGRLTAVYAEVIRDRPTPPSTVVYWHCLCECGGVARARASHLTRGNVKSCGCLTHSPITNERRRLASTSHGRSKTAEYKIWQAMKERCQNPRHKAYKHYGGRGIEVCTEWAGSFDAFYRFMGPRPSPAHSLDRFPDSDGDYTPGNVRWATQTEQCNNLRKNRHVVYRGGTMTVAQAARRAGVVPANTVYARLHGGWSETAAIETPHRYKRFTSS